MASASVYSLSAELSSMIEWFNFRWASRALRDIAPGFRPRLAGPGATGDGVACVWSLSSAED